MIYRIVPFPMTLNDPDFKGTPLFDVEYLRNDTDHSKKVNCAIANDLKSFQLLFSENKSI